MILSATTQRNLEKNKSYSCGGGHPSPSSPPFQFPGRTPVLVPLREGIGKELESKTDFLFDKLAVKNTRADVVKTVKQAPIYPDLEAEISACH
jgi:hypothetical protein